jgi:hypothetical protein
MMTRALTQDGRAASGSPTATQQRGHEQSAFVEEDQGGVQSMGFFLARATGL